MVLKHKNQLGYEEAITALGVKRASLPRKGKKGIARTKYENEKWFKDLQRYRAAGEAKISLLKRKYGLNRSKYPGLPFQIWTFSGATSQVSD